MIRVYKITELYVSGLLALKVRSMKRIISCNITQYSICDAFVDFFDNMPENDIVYSKEDMIKILDSFIESYK